MTKYMVRVYVRYHISRFAGYWRNEKRTFLKDLASARLASMLAFALCAISIISFLTTGNAGYRNAGVVFLAFGMATHIFRDYRTGRHIGWKRMMDKERGKNG